MPTLGKRTTRKVAAAAASTAAVADPTDGNSSASKNATLLTRRLTRATSKAKSAVAYPPPVADGTVASPSAAVVVTRSRKAAQPGKGDNVNPPGAKPRTIKKHTAKPSIPAEEADEDASLGALVDCTADDASPQRRSRRERVATDFFASATEAPAKKQTKLDGSQSPSKGKPARKKKNDSATAQKEKDTVGFVSDEPILKGRPTRTAPEHLMRFFKRESLLPQALINKAEQKLHVGYHPSWIKGDTFPIVMTCVCCGAEGTVHTFGKHACPNFTSLKKRPRDISHLKLARISVNTLNNVPSQDGDNDELVNLKDVDDDAE